MAMESSSTAGAVTVTGYEKGHVGDEFGMALNPGDGIVFLLAVDVGRLYQQEHQGKQSTPPHKLFAPVRTSPTRCRKWLFLCHGLPTSIEFTCPLS